jgi:hypothetical protein
MGYKGSDRWLPLWWLMMSQYRSCAEGHCHVRRF